MFFDATRNWLRRFFEGLDNEALSTFIPGVAISAPLPGRWPPSQRSALSFILPLTLQRAV